MCPRRNCPTSSLARRQSTSVDSTPVGTFAKTERYCTTGTEAAGSSKAPTAVGGGGADAALGWVTGTAPDPTAVMAAVLRLLLALTVPHMLVVMWLDTRREALQPA